MGLIRPEDEAAHQAELASREVNDNRQDFRRYVEPEEVDWPRLALYLVESFRSGHRAANPDRRRVHERLTYKWPVSDAQKVEAEATLWAAIYEIVGDNSFTLDVTTSSTTLWIELAAKRKHA